MTKKKDDKEVTLWIHFKINGYLKGVYRIGATKLRTLGPEWHCPPAEVFGDGAVLTIDVPVEVW